MKTHRLLYIIALTVLGCSDPTTTSSQRGGGLANFLSGDLNRQVQPSFPDSSATEIDQGEPDCSSCGGDVPLDTPSPDTAELDVTPPLDTTLPEEVGVVDINPLPDMAASDIPPDATASPPDILPLQPDLIVVVDAAPTPSDILPLLPDLTLVADASTPDVPGMLVDAGDMGSDADQDATVVEPPPPPVWPRKVPGPCAVVTQDFEQNNMYTVLYDYDEHEKAIYQWKDRQSDGTVDETINYTNTYNELNQLLRIDVDERADNSDRHLDYTYSEEGWISSEVTTHLANPNSGQRFRWSYNENGLETVELRETFPGRLLLEVKYHDYDAEGYVTQFSQGEDPELINFIMVYTYDEDHSSVQITFQDASQVAFAWKYQTLNEFGQVLTNEARHENGVVYATEHYEYDEVGNVMLKEENRQAMEVTQRYVYDYSCWVN